MRWLQTVVKLAAQKSWSEFTPGAVLELPNINAGDNPWWPLDPNKPSHANEPDAKLLKTGMSYPDQWTDEGLNKFHALADKMAAKIAENAAKDIEDVVLHGGSPDQIKKATMYMSADVTPGTQVQFFDHSQAGSTDWTFQDLNEIMKSGENTHVVEPLANGWEKHSTKLKPNTQSSVASFKEWLGNIMAETGVGKEGPFTLEQHFDALSEKLHQIDYKIITENYVPAKVFDALSETVQNMAMDIYNLQTELKDVQAHLATPAPQPPNAFSVVNDAYDVVAKLKAMGAGFTQVETSQEAGAFPKLQVGMEFLPKSKGAIGALVNAMTGA